MKTANMVLGHPARRFLALAIDFCVCVAIYLGLKAAGASGARLSVFFISAAWACFALPTASRFGGSLGTRLAGLVVTDRYGERVRIVRASCRAMLSVLSAGMFGMGYMLLFFTRKRQTLHDLYTNTLVLDAQATMSRLNQDSAPATGPSDAPNAGHTAEPDAGHKAEHTAKQDGNTHTI